MNWYINKKTNELVQAIWEEDVNGKDYSCWFVYKDGRKIAELNVADFQSQYGEAMVCPKRGLMICRTCSLSKPHLCDYVDTDTSNRQYNCPDCIPYIPEQKQADEEPVFPICGTCNARKDAYLLLPPEKIRDILQTGGTPEDFSIEIAKAELDHLAKPEMEVYKRIYCKHWDKVNDKCLVSVDDCIRPNFDCYDDIPLSDYIKGEGK